MGPWFAARALVDPVEDWVVVPPDDDEDDEAAPPEDEEAPPPPVEELLEFDVVEVLLVFDADPPLSRDAADPRDSRIELDSLPILAPLLRPRNVRASVFATLFFTAPYSGMSSPLLETGHDFLL